MENVAFYHQAEELKKEFFQNNFIMEYKHLSFITVSIIPNIKWIFFSEFDF